VAVVVDWANVDAAQHRPDGLLHPPRGLSVSLPAIFIRLDLDKSRFQGFSELL
jgi:hypothetical protein